MYIRAPAPSAATPRRTRAASATCATAPSAETFSAARPCWPTGLYDII